jgi:YYY domain-containing protein
LAFILFSGLILSGVILWVRRRRLLAFLRANWREILRIEGIFLILYLGWVGFRYLNPDLWHPVSGGEKPMDFAYLNAVIKSTWFPPYDPWFAGGQMNYYYFGFVLIGSLIELLGIVPSIAYNLAVPSLFALTGLGAYTIASSLVGGDDHRAVRAGIWGIAIVVVLGNLGEVQLIFNGLVDIGGVDFESLIPGYPEVVSALVGLWKMISQGQTLSFRPERWYWDATRIIPFAEGEVGPINEFPAFTFIYADLHAHMLALPLTYVALAIALQWGMGILGSDRAGWKRFFPNPFSSLLLAMLIGGALRATNTWDYPTYLVLMTFGSLLGAAPVLNLTPTTGIGHSFKGGHTLKTALGWLGRLLVTPILLLAGAELLFRPFVANYVVTYSTFGLWKGTRTPLGIYLLMLGQFLYPLALGVWIDGRRWFNDSSGARSQRWRVIAVAAGVLVLGLSVILVFFDAPVGWVVVPMGLFSALHVLAPRSRRRRMLWLWVGSALALSLLVEIVVLRGDIGRMNTVFKFQYQVWTLLGVSAAVFIERIMHGWLSNAEEAGLKDVAVVLMALLLLGAALYPVLAIPAKTQDRWAAEAPLTLDGMTYMAYATQYEHGSDIPLLADYKVIRWLQENVEGSPVIIEGVGEREYLWNGRISVYTGLPAVAAWRWHQVQQRGAMPPGTVESRMQDVRYFYNGASPEEAIEILDEYDVSYVILTPYERAYMIAEGQAKFAYLVDNHWLDVVYEDASSKIYRVTSLVN